MTTQIVIPVKRLPGALRRLSGVLDPRERGLLQEAMLRDMLVACVGTDGVDEVLVVTSDDTAIRRATEAGARWLPDHDPPRGINAAVAVGRRDAAERGHRAVVLTADLPLIQPDDITAVVSTPCPAPGVVLVPSHTGLGTNALLMDPPAVFRTRLGEDSRARHQASAREVGCGYHEVERERIALDIDTPEDLRRMLQMDPPTRTLEVCVALDLASRLQAVSPA